MFRLVFFSSLHAFLLCFVSVLLAQKIYFFPPLACSISAHVALILFCFSMSATHDACVFFFATSNAFAFTIKSNWPCFRALRKFALNFPPFSFFFRAHCRSQTVFSFVFRQNTIRAFLPLQYAGSVFCFWRGLFFHARLPQQTNIISNTFKVFLCSPPIRMIP